MKINTSKLHIVMAVVWILTAIPSLLWWKESLLWIIFISLYANIATHLGGYEAAKAKETN